MCTARCWRSFISLWWPVYFSLLWFAGEAASEPATPIDAINSLRRLALWLAVHRTLWRLWWRGWHWKNCYPSWIILSTLSTSHWSDSGAPPPKDCFSFAVRTTDKGNLLLAQAITSYNNSLTSAWQRDLWSLYCFYSIYNMFTSANSMFF